MDALCPYCWSPVPVKCRPSRVVWDGSTLSCVNLNLLVGDTFSAEFRQSAGTPYSWRLAPSPDSPAIMTTSGPRCEALHSIPHLCGGPQRIAWDFTALRAGHAVVEFNFNHISPGALNERTAKAFVNIYAPTKKT